MRSLNWPYHRIVKWLYEEQRISISKEGIRKFCRVRSIHKGIDTSLAVAPTQQIRPYKTNSSEKPFTFDDGDAEKPIQIKRR